MVICSPEMPSCKNAVDYNVPCLRTEPSEVANLISLSHVIMAARQHFRL